MQQFHWLYYTNYIFSLQVARLRKHSLQVAPESVYPSIERRGSYRFLRASYTAGSMAGLGFSMAILGICIGIFLGFLLWKRRLGVIPYYLSPWHRSGPEEVMGGVRISAGSDFGLLNSHQYQTSQSLVSDLPTFDANDQLTAPILVPMSPPPPADNLEPLGTSDRSDGNILPNSRRYWFEVLFDNKWEKIEIHQNTCLVEIVSLL